MIFTRTHLNGRRPTTRKLMGSPQAMHAAILSGFPPGSDPGRVLWRLDGAETPTPTLYVVSRTDPDFAHLDEQAGWPTQRMAESAPYDGFLAQLANGQSWAFRITVNPTHRTARNGRSQVMAHVTVAQQAQWLADRADSMGVHLTRPSESGGANQRTFDLVERATRTFHRQESTVTLGTATFEGRLMVADRQRLRDALTTGVGRAKAYGCGLMTLARP